MKVLITGVAGFIGARVAERLLGDGHEIVGLDSLVNRYQDADLKKARLGRIRQTGNLRFLNADVAIAEDVVRVFSEHPPDWVLHFAAQTGVRDSFSNPEHYVETNIRGFLNVLECSRQYSVKHLLYASSSSVYGANGKIPSATTDRTDQPISIYAVTKKANELMAHSHSYQFGLPTTGLRFFTVYGPWGRPDMALFKFTKALLEGKPIELFNDGRHRRGFTYIDDVAEGVVRALGSPPRPTATSGEKVAPHRIYNLGSQVSLGLEEVVATLEGLLKKKANRVPTKQQPGDVLDSLADTAEFERDFNFRPSISFAEGAARFVAWYREYYRIQA